MYFLYKTGWETYMLWKMSPIYSKTVAFSSLDQFNIHSIFITEI